MTRKAIATIILALAVAACSTSEAPTNVEPTSTPIVEVTQAPTAAPTAEPTPEVTPEPTSSLTTSQENAVAKAQDYLAYGSFSRKGLIDQLVFEDFSKADATFAVDSLKIDWNEQAYLKGKEYLEYQSFSLKSLTAQLKFEGFTKEQATYGATKAYK